MRKDSVIYYKDELNDEFSGISRKTFLVNETFKYINSNVFYKFFRFIVYRLIMTPVAFLYSHIKFKVKIYNKKVLKEYKKTGYFLYSNHTNVPLDAYLANLVSYPTNTYVIVNAENLSVKGTRTFMKMVGALPIPNSIKGMPNFLRALDYRSQKGSSIVIFPEAHIWPYYNKIRPFKDVSFRYPIKENKPIFSYTVCYKKRKYSKKPRVEVYVDGPFMPNNNCEDLHAEQTRLRNLVYEAMSNEATLHSDYEYIKYVRKED